MQEKVAPEELVRKVNERIAFLPEESEPMEVEPEVKPEKMEV
jgi:hypothetical protein